MSEGRIIAGNRPSVLVPFSMTNWGYYRENLKGRGFWSEVQRVYENRICTSLPSSLRMAWSGVSKPISAPGRARPQPPENAVQNPPVIHSGNAARLVRRKRPPRRSAGGLSCGSRPRLRSNVARFRALLVQLRPASPRVISRNIFGRTTAQPPTPSWFWKPSPGTFTMRAAVVTIRLDESRHVWQAPRACRQPIGASLARLGALRWPRT